MDHHKLTVTSGGQEKTRAALRAFKWNIAAAFLLALIKISAGIFTASMAVMASALDSLMDVATSIVNLIALKKASKPPDEDHSYGHGKIESLASLFQSIFIGLTGLFLVFESGKKLFLGSRMQDIPTGIATMVFSMAVSIWIALRMNRLHGKNGSLIVETERIHYLTDVLTSLGIIFTLILVSLTGHVIWDLVVSIGLSFYIFRASYTILRRAIDELLDRSLPPVSKEEIEKMIRTSHPAIVGLHNFRSRQVGEQIFLDFHIEIRDENDFRKAHLLTEALITQIQERYPTADVTVHFDPEGES